MTKIEWTDRTLGGLKQMGNSLSDAVKHPSSVKSKLGLQSTEPLSDWLATLAIFVLRVALDQETVLTCILDEPINQA